MAEFRHRYPASCGLREGKRVGGGELDDSTDLNDRHVPFDVDYFKSISTGILMAFCY